SATSATKSAKSGLMHCSKGCVGVSLFDHPVGACQYCIGDCDAECRCRPEINRQLDLRGLLDRKISRLRPGQYLLHVFSSAMIHGSSWRPVAHQGASVRELRNVGDGGKSLFECQRGDGLTEVIEGGIGHDDQRLGRLPRDGMYTYPQERHAQQISKPARLGYIWIGAKDSEHPTRDGLRQGLRGLGYVEGRDFVLEERYAESHGSTRSAASIRR